MISGVGLSVGTPASAGACHPYRHTCSTRARSGGAECGRWPRSHSAEGCIKNEHAGLPVIGYRTGALPKLQPWCVPQTARWRVLFFHIRRRFDQGRVHGCNSPCPRLLKTIVIDY